MTIAEASLKLVEEMPASLIESLIQQLRAGGLHPCMPNPGYQARVEAFVGRGTESRLELAPMLEVALAAKRSRPTVELVWTGPATSVVPVRRTEQVMTDLIDSANRKLTIMSFGIFQVPRLVESLEHALERQVDIRIILGDREAQTDWVIDQQRYQLGAIVASKASLCWWPHKRRLRDDVGCAGLMHAKAAVADSRTAFLTSANLTEAALERNIELGVLIHGGALPGAIDRLVDALLESGELEFL
jgi:phosphatidylserine/phosphatidylglycerophosphate/cardiolipin synthase-like enzyme